MAGSAFSPPRFVLFFLDSALYTQLRQIPSHTIRRNLLPNCYPMSPWLRVQGHRIPVEGGGGRGNTHSGPRPSLLLDAIWHHKFHFRVNLFTPHSQYWNRRQSRSSPECKTASQHMGVYWCYLRFPKSHSCFWIKYHLPSTESGFSKPLYDLPTPKSFCLRGHFPSLLFYGPQTMINGVCNWHACGRNMGHASFRHRRSGVYLYHFLLASWSNICGLIFVCTKSCCMEFFWWAFWQRFLKYFLLSRIPKISMNLMQYYHNVKKKILILIPLMQNESKTNKDTTLGAAWISCH